MAAMRIKRSIISYHCRSSSILLIKVPIQDKTADIKVTIESYLVLTTAPQLLPLVVRNESYSLVACRSHFFEWDSLRKLLSVIESNMMLAIANVDRYGKYAGLYFRFNFLTLYDLRILIVLKVNYLDLYF